MLATARAVLEREARAVAEAADQIATSFTDAASLILAADGLVFVSGIGTSHAVALHVAGRGQSFSIRPTRDMVGLGRSPRATS
jgi:D-arabinose 5-phosphate isomerase GutQ